MSHPTSTTLQSGSLTRNDVMFTMLFGQLCFYDTVPQELCKKIKTAELSIPDDERVSVSKSLLVTDLVKRMMVRLRVSYSRGRLLLLVTRQEAPGNKLTNRQISMLK